MRRIIPVFAAGSLLYLLGAMTRCGIPGAWFAELQREFGASASAVAALASTRAAATLGCTLLAAPLIDRRDGARMCAAGGGILACGLGLGAIAGDFPLLLAGAAIEGVGLGWLYLAVIRLADRSFDRRYFSLVLGFFYLAAYGGTALGNAPFAAACGAWGRSAFFGSLAPLAAGLGLFLYFRRGQDPAAEQGRGFFNLKRRHFNGFNLRFLYCGAFNVGVYWFIQNVIGKKYLEDVVQLPAGTAGGVTGMMSLIVMVEMVFAGSVSFWCGNRRKPFWVLGSGLLLLGVAGLFAGTFFPPGEAVARVFFGCLGAGYGVSGLYIVSCREYLPKELVASSVGLLNALANLGLIAVSQLTGFLLDAAGQGAEGRYPAYVYALVFGGLLAGAAAGFLFSWFHPETRGRNRAAAFARLSGQTEIDKNNSFFAIVFSRPRVSGWNQEKRKPAAAPASRPPNTSA